MKISDERIEINERLFAVKVQSNETEWLWVIGKTDEITIGDDFRIICAHEDLTKAVIEALRRLDNFNLKIQDHLMGFLSKFSNDIYLSDNFNLEDGCFRDGEKFSEISYDQEDKCYRFVSEGFFICGHE
jgi:hypothetical protein